MQFPFVIDTDLKNAMASSSDFLLATDLEGNIVFYNDVFVKLYQLKGTNVKGLNIDSIFNSKEVAIFKNALLKCTKNKLHTEQLQFKKPNHQSEVEWYEFFMNVVCNNKGVIVGVVIKDHSNSHLAIQIPNKEIDFKKECFWILLY